MSVDHEVEDKGSQLWSAYLTTLSAPFRENYDKWEEEPYWKAVETFKVESKDIGYEDPFEYLGQFGLTSYEVIRDKLKAGPPLCLREGWKSPCTGENVDVLAIFDSVHHAAGPKFEGKERIVIIDFWATWCAPCLYIASRLSDTFEKHAGRVAVIGLANDDMFNKKKEHHVEKIKTFLETHEESFRYSSYIDIENIVRDSLFAKIQYKAVPCLILVVDNMIRFAGGNGFLDENLEAVMKELYPGV